MGRHLLGDFESAAVLEIRSDTGGAEGMTADLGFDAGLGRAAANHSPHIGLQQRVCKVVGWVNLWG